MIRIEQHWIKAIVSLASFVNSEKVSNNKEGEEWEFLSGIQTRGRLVHKFVLLPWLPVTLLVVISVVTMVTGYIISCYKCCYHGYIISN